MKNTADREAEIQEAAKTHCVPVSWVKAALKTFDVEERGIDFACYYGVAMKMDREPSHVVCMKKAVYYLEAYRSNTV